MSFAYSQIEMSHGAGGKATRKLIENLIAPTLMNPLLACFDDSALIDIDSGKLAFTSDSFVVNPIRFSGGSIGDLAVNGTVNDLAVSGAKPLALVLNIIIEAGLPTDVLKAEIEAVARAAKVAGVNIVGGDTKVVEHGKADHLFMTTAGIGMLDKRLSLGIERIELGDKIILSGPIGDHGISILLARGELELESNLSSDTRSVWSLVNSLIEQTPNAVKWMRDPTRGGVATSLNELAKDLQLGIKLTESDIPIHDSVRGACELLGLDPLHIANEGQFLAVVSATEADKALAALHKTPGGSGAKIIAEIIAEPMATVLCETAYGSTRVIDMLVGDPLPRIC